METNYEITIIDWNEIRKLTKNILSEIEKKDIQIDTLVPIVRGGMPLALFLSSNMKNVDTACIHIKRSLTNTVNAAFGIPKVLGVTNPESIKGKNILLTEDTVDVGLTLDCAIEEIKKYEPKNIYIATFYNFNKEKYRDIICGEYKKEQCWIIFPWEEDIINGK